MLFTSCAHIAIPTISAFRLKMSSVSAVASASRIVTCCPKMWLGSSSVPSRYHGPYSSTTSLIRRSLSNCPSAAHWSVTIRSIPFASRITSYQSIASNFSASPFAATQSFVFPRPRFHE